MPKGVMMLIHGSAKRLLLLLIVFAAILSADSLKIRVTGTEVVEGNNLQVKLIAEGKDIKFPDIKDIGGFPTEGNSVSTKMESSYPYGKFSSKNLKTLRFDFFPEVDVTIPAFTVNIGGKNHKTKPIDIRVIKPSAVTARSVDGYTMTMKSSKKKLYVGEPFVVTVKFFEPRSSRVSKVEYTPPKFKDFFSQALGGDKLKRSANGTIHQLEYLLSAKKQGKFTIMPPKARVGIRSISGALGFFANDVKWYSVRAKSLPITVKPLPADTDLVGVFTVESRVDKNSIKPNNPVTYTIKIMGEGSLEDIEDPKFDLPNVTVYSDDAKSESKVMEDKVMSIYEKKYVFISDSDFTIPALSFSSFNYKLEKSKTLKTDAKKIVVDSMGIQVPVKTIKAFKPIIHNIRPKKTEDKNISILEDVDYYQGIYDKERIGFPFWSLLLSFLVGVLATLLSIRLMRYFIDNKQTTKLRHYKSKEALKILYPHTNHSSKIEVMVRKLYEVENGNKSVIIDKDELARMIAEIRN